MLRLNSAPERAADFNPFAEKIFVPVSEDHLQDACRKLHGATSPVTKSEVNPSVCAAPDHPRLFEFIEFWQREIEGPLHSVAFSHRKMIAPGEWRNVTGEFTLH